MGTARIGVIIAAMLGCGGDPQGVPSDADPIIPPIDQGPPAVLAMTPDPVDFGTGVVNAPTMKVVTVSNVGGSASGSIFAHFEGADADQFFIVSNLCATLGAADACMVNIAYRPKSMGAAAATLIVSDGTLTVTAAVKGTAIISAALLINEGSHTFAPTVIGPGVTAAPVTFTITNVGGLPTGMLTTLVGGPNMNNFPLTDNCTNAVLAPNTSCTITAGFTPQAPRGSKSGGFNVSGVPGGNAGAMLQGQALAPARLEWLPNQADFGFVPASQQSVIALTLVNTGDVDSGTVTNLYNNNPSAEFSIVSDACAGQTVAPAMSCDTVVQFAPTAMSVEGPRSTTLVASANPGGPAGAQLTAFTTGSGSTLRITPDGNFGSVALGGNRLITFTVTNVGPQTTGSLKAAIKVSSPNKDFTIPAAGDHCSGVLLQPNDTCVLDVVFAPLGTMMMINASATLVVASTSPVAWGSMPLTGNNP